MAKKKVKIGKVKPVRKVSYAGPIKEQGAYARVEVWKHTNGGVTTIKAYDSTNAQIVPDVSEKDEKVMGLGVHVGIVEDKAVTSDSFYTKQVNLRQYRDNASVAVTNPAVEQPVSAAMPDGTVRAGMDKSDYLKNFYDKIADEVRENKNWLIAALIVSAAAFAIAVYGAFA